MPTQGAIAAAQTQCKTAGRNLEAFDARAQLDQALREVFLSERQRLANVERERCAFASERAGRREAALAARQSLVEAQAALAALQAGPLPDNLIAGPGRTTLRDILVKALVALVAITLVPFVYRTIAYYALAPIAARWPPIRFAPAG